MSASRDLRRHAAKAQREAQAARRAKDAPAPFAGTILDAMEAAGLVGETWAAWRTFWRAVFALPMDEPDRERFARHTGRTMPPSGPVREAWTIAGRRSGKSRNAAVGAAFLAVARDYTQLLAPGERGTIPVIAADRKQAGQVLRYLKGIARLERFAPYVGRMLKESVEFKTGVTVEVHAASWRTTRGYTVVGLICDELAFWLGTDETAANPDSEVLNALRPGMLTVPGALLLVISSPYACRGALYAAHERAYGQDDPRTLVWNGSTVAMNPTADAGAVREAFEADPVAAASEFGDGSHVAFRRDVEALLDLAAVRAVTVGGRRELPPAADTSYVAFCDPSGGSQDSMTLAIAHNADGVAVLDCVREVRPPFSPETVVADFAAVLATYRISEVVGDRYGGEWPREAFRKCGIEYKPSEKNKSAIYSEMVALVNGTRVELLDLPRLIAQLASLERKTARGGRDSIDHPPGGHDDAANAASGALLLAGATVGRSFMACGFGEVWDMEAGTLVR